MRSCRASTPSCSISPMMDPALPRVALDRILLDSAFRKGKKPRLSPTFWFTRFFNARRFLAGVELVHKIIKGRLGLPESFGTDPLCMI
jgi:hypothetical protein